MGFATIRSRFLAIIVGLLAVAMIPVVFFTKINFETEIEHLHAVQAGIKLQSLMQVLETEYDRLVRSELEMVENRRENLENLMSAAMKMVGIWHHRSATGRIPVAEAQEAVSEWIRTFRFGTGGFFFVCDLELRGRAHPMPEMEGRMWTGFEDVRLQDAFGHMRDIIEEEKAVHEVLTWPSPAAPGLTRQTAYFRYFPEWKWIVGVSAPFDELEKDADAERDKILRIIESASGKMDLTGKEHFILLNAEGKALIGAESGSHPATAKTTVLPKQGSDPGTVGLVVENNRLIHSMHFKPFDWHLLLEFEEDVALEPTNRLLSKQIYYFLAVFVVGLALAMVLGRNLARPIEALARFARNLPEQNFDVTKASFPKPLDSSEAEIVQLAEAFTFMASRLKRHLGELDGHRDQLGELIRMRTGELLRANESLNGEIAERRRSEAELREKTRLNQILLDAFPCIALLLRPKLREIVASNKAATQVGAVPGKTCFSTWGQGTGPCPWCLAPETWATGEPRHVEVRGLGIWWDAHWIPIDDDLYMHFAFDITDRKRSEEALVESEKALRLRTSQLETMQKIGLEVTAELDLQSLLQSIAAKSLEVVGGSSSGLFLNRPENQVLEIVAAAGKPLQNTGETFPPDQGFIGVICETRKPFLVSDYRVWEGRLPDFEEQNVISVMGVPIFWHESFLGVLVVRGDAPDRFSPGDVDILGLLAIQAAVAIRNAEMFDRIQKDAKTRNELLREVNHRVGNNLTAISGLLALERRHLTGAGQDSYKEIMDDLTNRVNSLGKVHELLSASEWSPLSLDKIVERVVHSSLRTLPTDRRFEVEITPSDVCVIAKQAHSLALILNELTTNAIKYALGDREIGRIAVRITRTGEMLEFEFEDDGPGYPDDVLRMERFNVGIDLIRQLTHRDLRGAVALHNRSGALASIRFPASREMPETIVKKGLFRDRNPNSPEGSGKKRR